jgi:hypothetical protein
MSWPFRSRDGNIILSRVHDACESGQDALGIGHG